MLLQFARMLYRAWPIRRDRLTGSMTREDQRVFRRRKRRSHGRVPAALWIGFVLLLGASCLTLFLFSFSWEDSPIRESSQSKPMDTSLAPDLAAQDFHAPAGGTSGDHRNASKIDLADEKVLKELESKFGPENAAVLPLQNGGEPGYAPPLAPTQSAKPGR